MKEKGSARRPAQRRKKKKGSALVVVALLLIILAAVLVLAFVYVRYFAAPDAQEASAPAVTEAPAAEATPAPTPEPTPEPTPAPELGYASAFSAMTSEADASALSYNKGKDERTLSTGETVKRTETGVTVSSSSGEQSVSCGGSASSLVALSDGSLALAAWTGNGYELLRLDASAGAFASAAVLPDSAVLLTDGAGEYLCFYASGVEFFGVKEDGTSEKLFNFTALDLSPSRVAAAKAEEDGSFSFCLSEYDAASDSAVSTLCTVSLQEKSSIPEKRELSLLSFNPLDTLQDAVMDYNRSHDSVRIVLYTPDAGDDALAALEAFSQSELGGKWPDLLDLSGLPYKELAAAGKLADLYPSLDADAELSRGDIVSPVLAFLECNGGLYGTASGFTLSTVVGPEKVLGRISSWTVNDYNSVTSTMGEGTYPFGAYDTQSAVLNDLLGLHLSEFIDWQELTCDFDNTSFTSLLEFLRRLPSEPRDTDDYELIPQNIQLLYRTQLYTAEDMGLVDTLFASPVYVGLPVAEGSGNLVNVFADYAVSADCEDVSAAWEFVRESFLAPESDALWYFPSNRSAYEAALSAAVESEAVTAEESEELTALVNAAVPNAVSSEIYNLVWDNIQGYLEGRDTAPGAANYVQEAVSAYLASLK